MRHIDDGTLRRLVDEPFAASDSQRRHYDSCTRCQSEYARIADRATASATLLAVPDSTPNTAAALARTWERIESDGSAPSGAKGRIMPRGFRQAGAALAGLAVAAGLVAWSPAGSWAEELVTVFQPSQVASVDLTSADLHDLAGLTRYGTLNAPSSGPTRTFHTATAASAALGMPLAEPDHLPSDVTGTPEYGVTSQESASFTFSAARAAAAGKSPMPAAIDGSTLHITVQPAAATVYRGDQSLPELVIGQMRAPTITSSGASVRDLEQYIIGLPDVPASVKIQIKALQHPDSTLPIPIPIDLAHATDVTVQGVHGVAVGDNTGLGSGVIWERDGMIYGVAGTLSQDDILAIANSLT